MTTDTTPIERAACCGPVCKRPPGDCVAGTYGAGVLRRLREAGFDVVPKDATLDA